METEKGDIEKYKLKRCIKSVKMLKSTSVKHGCNHKPHHEQYKSWAKYSVSSSWEDWIILVNNSVEIDNIIRIEGGEIVYENV